MYMRMSCANGFIVALDWYLPRAFFRSGVSGAGVLILSHFTILMTFRSIIPCKTYSSQRFSCLSRFGYVCSAPSQAVSLGRAYCGGYEAYPGIPTGTGNKR